MADTKTVLEIERTWNGKFQTDTIHTGSVNSFTDDQFSAYFNSYDDPDVTDDIIIISMKAQKINGKLPDVVKIKLHGFNYWADSIDWRGKKCSTMFFKIDFDSQYIQSDILFSRGSYTEQINLLNRTKHINPYSVFIGELKNDGSEDYTSISWYPEQGAYINNRKIKLLKYNNKKITKININSKDCTLIHPNSFTGTFTSEDKANAFKQAKTISNNQFAGETGITGIKTSATSIGARAFKDSPLTSLIITDATTIGDHAFQSIVNERSTEVVWPDKFNTDAEKTRIFGGGHWNKIIFNKDVKITPAAFKELARGWISKAAGFFSVTIPQHAIPRLDITADKALHIAPGEEITFTSTPESGYTVNGGDSMSVKVPTELTNAFRGSFTSQSKEDEFMAIGESLDVDSQFKDELGITAIYLPNLKHIMTANCFWNDPITILDLPKLEDFKHSEYVGSDIFSGIVNKPTTFVHINPALTLTEEDKYYLFAHDRGDGTYEANHDQITFITRTGLLSVKNAVYDEDVVKTLIKGWTVADDATKTASITIVPADFPDHLTIAVSKTTGIADGEEITVTISPEDGWEINFNEGHDITFTMVPYSLKKTVFLGYRGGIKKLLIIILLILMILMLVVVS